MLVVVGVGQTLRGDDSVGPVVVQEWVKKHSKTAQDQRVSVEICNLPGLALLDVLIGFETAILVDAVLGGPRVTPGSLLLFNPAGLESFSPAAGSAHGWGVAETLKLAETLQMEGIPDQLNILGIAAAQVELGAEMSPVVKNAIPAAVGKLQEMVVELLDL